MSQTVEFISVGKSFEKVVKDIEQSLGSFGGAISHMRANLAEIAALGTNAIKNVDNEWRNKWLALETYKVKRIKEVSVEKIKNWEKEHDKEISLAIEKGEKIANIDKYYNTKIFEEQKEFWKARNTHVSAWVDNYKVATKQINDALTALNNRMKNNLDKYYEEEKAKVDARLKNRKITEQQAAEQIEAINEEMAEKKLKLDREQAIRTKAYNIFTTTIDTAKAFVKALADLGPIAGIAAAATIAAAGAIQVGLIASEPLPFYAGGLIKGTPTGILAQIGEKNQDEVILPLERGTDQIADKLIGAMRMSQNSPAIEYHSHYHIGTLIADDNGLKTLERKLRPHRAAEDRRTGINEVYYNCICLHSWIDYAISDYLTLRKVA